jgi:alcohol dehydrogenase class IV
LKNIMRFEFITASRIIFGEGAARELGTLAMPFGKRALVVTGRSPSRVQTVIDSLRSQPLECVLFAVDGEPTVALVVNGAEQARRAQAEVVVSIGGGSVLDAGKAIAALATNPGDPYDYMEVIGKGQALRHAPLPFIAVPTRNSRTTCRPL